VTFSEQVKADTDNVFFNTGEFAETVIIDGRPVPIIRDDDALNGKSDVYAMGLAEGEQFIFVREGDMFRLPQPGEQLTKEGKQWYIRHAVRNMGVFELRIGRDRVHE